MLFFSPKLWCVPHTNPRKMGEVLDCSPQYTNLSINKELMLVAHLIIQIVDMLLRFKKNRVGFMTDTKSINFILIFGTWTA